MTVGPTTPPPVPSSDNEYHHCSNSTFSIDSGGRLLKSYNIRLCAIGVTIRRGSCSTMSWGFGPHSDSVAYKYVPGDKDALCGMLKKFDPL